MVIKHGYNSNIIKHGLNSNIIHALMLGGIPIFDRGIMCGKEIKNKSIEDYSI